MDFETLVQARKSIRGFKNEPVPRDVIEDIIEVAKRAPSSMNTQPWHVHVLTGAPLEQVRKRNMEAMMAHAKPKREINVSDEYQGVHRTRQVDIAKKLFGAMGHDRPLELNVIECGQVRPASEPGFRSLCGLCGLITASSTRLRTKSSLPLRKYANRTCCGQNVEVEVL